jgi:hypothetical protein
MVKNVHDDNEEKWREWAPLLYAGMHQKGQVLPSLEVSSEGNVVKKPLDGIAELDRKTNMLKDGMYRIMRDRVKSL